MLWNLTNLALTQFEYYMIESNKLYILKFQSNSKESVKYNNVNSTPPCLYKIIFPRSNENQSPSSGIERRSSPRPQTLTSPQAKQSCMPLTFISMKLSVRGSKNLSSSSFCRLHPYLTPRVFFFTPLHSQSMHTTLCPARAFICLQTNEQGETDYQVQMNRLRFTNNRSTFKTSGKFPVILEESMEYTLL